MSLTVIRFLITQYWESGWSGRFSGQGIHIEPHFYTWGTSPVTPDKTPTDVVVVVVFGGPVRLAGFGVEKVDV